MVNFHRIHERHHNLKVPLSPYTCLLLLRDAHDPEGIYGFSKQIFILLSSNSYISIQQETVLIVVL